MEALSTSWPLFGLHLSTPRLELRAITDEDLPAFQAAALAGIHEPGRSPFSFPWTDVPDAELPANMARHVWRTRAQTRTEDWTLSFGVWHEGDLVGMQDLMARDFADLRTVSTGSWLTRTAQGRGIGTEMRTAVVLYAFDYLGAEVAESDAASWNHSSLGVSHAVGYQDNGVTRRMWAGQSQEVQLVRLTPGQLRRPEWQLEVAGHDALASFLHLPEAALAPPGREPVAVRSTME